MELKKKKSQQTQNTITLHCVETMFSNFSLHQ